MSNFCQVLTDANEVLREDIAELHEYSAQDLAEFKSMRNEEIKKLQEKRITTDPYPGFPDFIVPIEL